MNKVLEQKNNTIENEDIFLGAAPGMKNMDELGEMLYNEYFTRIQRYFSFRIFDKCDAEDLAQTVFLKIFQCLKNGLWEGTGDICYIFTVARNTLIDYFRRSKHSQIVSDEIVEAYADSVTMNGSIEQAEQHELILSAMKGLRKEESDAVTLRFFQDMEYPVIAELMGKKESTVRQLVHRGLKSLRSNLEFV